MTFGRDVFDPVFPQPTGPRNNHLNQNVPKRNHYKCTKSNVCPKTLKLLIFRHMNCRVSVFVLLCVATPDLQKHMNRAGNNAKQRQKVKQLINLNFKSVRF